MTLALRLLRGYAGAIYDLIGALVAGTPTGDLFDLSPHGVNEFDLILVADAYYWVQDNKTLTNVRHAATVGGLASAAIDSTVNVRYPSIQWDGSTWHVWGQHPGTFGIDHYTASSVTGPWTLADSFGTHMSDPQVRQDPVTGTWWCAYKKDSPLYVGMFSSSSPDGPWTDQGYTFTTAGHPAFASVEEADPCPAFFNGHAYLSFAGYDGMTQVIAMTELDRGNSMQALTSGTIIRSPSAGWEGSKIFTPVFLDDGSKRLYYAANAGDTTAGWGAVTAA